MRNCPRCNGPVMVGTHTDYMIKTFDGYRTTYVIFCDRCGLEMTEQYDNRDELVADWDRGRRGPQEAAGENG